MFRGPILPTLCAMQGAVSPQTRSSSRPATPVSARGLGVAAFIAAVAVLAALLWPGRDARVEQPGESMIVMDEYSFSPGSLAWRAGETVTITVLNRSSSRPGADHEIMFGRRPLSEQSILGPVQGDGFEEQLLDGVTVELLAGNGVTMIMADTARLAGVDPMSLMRPGMDMTGQAMRPGMDFMAVVAARGSLTFRFQVPDRPGEWEFGCFAQDGQHYLNGMKGIVAVSSR